jgi:actin-related protein
VGVIEEYVDKTESMDTSTMVSENGSDAKASADISHASSRVNRKYLIDAMSFKTPRPHMNVQSFLKDGLIHDWDIFEKVLDYTFNRHLRCDPTQHPILFSEPVTNTKQKREKICEIVFEKFQAPGFYLSKNGVLSA